MISFRQIKNPFLFLSIILIILILCYENARQDTKLFQIREKLNISRDRLFIARTSTTPPFFIFLSATADLTKLDFITQHIWSSGSWEPHILGIMEQFLNVKSDHQNRIVLDIGANTGFFGLFAAAKGWIVHAVEAMTTNSENALLSAKINGVSSSYFLHQNAVGSTNGGKFCICATTSNPTDGILIPWVSRFNHSFCGKIVEDKGCHDIVSIRTLDSIIPENNLIQFIKIDVEGFELFALEGAQRILRKQTPCGLLLELNVHLMKSNGYDSVTIVSKLKNWGYMPAKFNSNHQRFEIDWHHEPYVGVIGHQQYTDQLFIPIESPFHCLKP
jgi:FkbM family methyltransferase